MNWTRTPPGYREAIGQAFDLFPERAKAIMGRPPIFGGDPIAAGLHSEAASGGHSLRRTAHALFPYSIERPASERIPTVVFPRLYEEPRQNVAVIVHELAHILDWHMWQRDADARPDPVNEYAETDAWEAFAEAACVMWLPDESWGWDGQYDGSRDVLLQDKATLHWFAEMAA